MQKQQKQSALTVLNSGTLRNVRLIWVSDALQCLGFQASSAVIDALDAKECTLPLCLHAKISRGRDRKYAMQ